MRDVVVLTIVFALVPVALARPWIGILGWTWVSLMNPHKLCWGIAFNFPVAQLIAIAALIGVVLTREKRSFPVTPVTALLILFILWMCVTSQFALHPELIDTQFKRVMKVQLMILVTLLFIHDRQRVDQFVWVMAASLAFFGVKGGIYTLLGGLRVYGPPGGFFEENNALALTMIMTIPLLFYLLQESHSRALRWALAASMVLCAAAALGSQSRGGLLAIAAMGFFLLLKSQRKIVMFPAIVLVSLVLLMFMPESWVERMRSIQNYEQDTSAMGRINAWAMAYNLAKDRFFGGGFEVSTPDLFARYAPNPLDLHVAHSIYFQVLGEHGFVGLFLFVLVWLSVWLTASATRRRARKHPDLQWAARLCNLVQVSLVGYLVGGTFLSLAYFDLPYNLLVLVVATRRIVVAQTGGSTAAARAPAARAASGGLGPAVEGA